MVRLTALALILCTSVASAALSDLEMTAEGKLLDKSVKADSATKSTTQQWAYDVAVFNKSAKDFGKLTIKYIVFVKDMPDGGKPGDARTIKKPGSISVDGIKSHAKYDFQTEKLLIQKTQLQGGWTYANGARPRSSDSLAGIWVRVYEGDKQVAEFSNPPTIATKEKWDPK